MTMKHSEGEYYSIHFRLVLPGWANSFGGLATQITVLLLACLSIMNTFMYSHKVVHRLKAASLIVLTSRIQTKIHEGHIQPTL